jgi:hypothetical protein
MPRINNAQYINRHRWLRQLWLKNPRMFSTLRPNQQWDIHDYYRPSERLTKKQLLQHRRQISRDRPALPHQASKALKILAGRAPTLKPISIKAGGSRHIEVYSLVQPQIDIERLARALLMLAEQIADEAQEGPYS